MPNVIIQKMNCLRCGHTWTPRQAEIRICPKCKSPYWDRPRRQATGSPKSPPKKIEGVHFQRYLASMRMA